MVSADLAEDLAFAVLPHVQVQVRVALAVTRREAEAPHPVDLHEGQVELGVQRQSGDSEGGSGRGGLSLGGGICYLVVFAGVPQKVPEEVKAGAFPHRDEVGGAVGQVCGGAEAFGAAGAGAAHAGSVDGQELPSDGPPLALTL